MDADRRRVVAAHVDGPHFDARGSRRMNPQYPPAHLAAVLAAPEAAREVEPGIWRTSNVADARVRYDTIGGAYDFVAGLDVYHRLFWGVSARAYRSFAEAAVLACGAGTLLDGGCGSMLFTARMHLRNEHGGCIGTDASLRMLRLARARLRRSANGRDISLVHADLLRGPFRSDAFDVVLCMHVAHVLDDVSGLVVEARRILKPHGTLFLTSVILVDSWRDVYLRMLSRQGIMAAPRRAEDLLDAAHMAFQAKPVAYRNGSMLFVQVKKPQP
jgi:ubiquinone/menaquinone biosynthesis C-methylase UbiE